MDHFNLSAWNSTFLLMNKYIEQYPWKMSHLGTRTNTFPCKFPLRWFCIRLSPENSPKKSGNISWDPWDEAISPANAWKIAKPGSWDARTTFTGLPSTWTHIALRCTKDTETHETLKLISHYPIDGHSLLFIISPLWICSKVRSGTWECKQVACLWGGVFFWFCVFLFWSFFFCNGFSFNSLLPALAVPSIN